MERKDKDLVAASTLLGPETLEEDLRNQQLSWWLPRVKSPVTSIVRLYPVLLMPVVHAWVSCSDWGKNKIAFIRATSAKSESPNP